MKKIVIFTLILFLCGCGNKMESDELYKIINDNNYIIIDVRTKDEYDASHIVNAINIPYDEINEEISIDKDKTIIVYCKSGNRSKIAYKKLVSLGYDVFDAGSYDNLNLDKE